MAGLCTKLFAQKSSKILYEVEIYMRIREVRVLSGRLGNHLHEAFVVIGYSRDLFYIFYLMPQTFERKSVEPRPHLFGEN